MYFCPSKPVFDTTSADEFDFSIYVLDYHGGRLIGGKIGVVEVDLVEGVDDLQRDLRVHIVEDVVDG